MKVYNLLFHLLRACNANPITSPITTRQGATLFDTLNGIMNVLSNNQQLVGGIRMEIRIRINHVLDAVDHVLERQQFDPRQFGVNCHYNKVPLRRYLVYAEGLFRTARALLTRLGVMRHGAGREMSNMEKIFGDLKLILGYRHYGYRTVPGRENPWWLQRAPDAYSIIGLIKLLYRLASVGLSILTFLTYLIVCMPFYKLLVYEYSKTYVRPLRNLN
jgi:hypothetical protein